MRNKRDGENEREEGGSETMALVLGIGLSKVVAAQRKPRHGADLRYGLSGDYAAADAALRLHECAQDRQGQALMSAFGGLIESGG
jgi:hypothetical protein